MNALSWMIYLAEVSDSVRWFVWTGAFVSLLAAVVSVIAWFAFEADLEKDEARIKGWKTNIPESTIQDAVSNLLGARVSVKAALRIAAPMFIVLFIIASFLPSKQTIMLIAASQVGEQVLNTDAAKEVGGIGLDTLHNLNDYLKSLVPKPVAEETK